MIDNREALLTAKVSTYTQLHNALPIKATMSSVSNCNIFVISSVFVHSFNDLHKVDEPAVYKPQDLPHGSVYSLDSHHSHFVLVEEDPNRPGATSEMRVKLLKHISLQRTGYGGKRRHVLARHNLLCKQGLHLTCYPFLTKRYSLVFLSLPL